MIWKKLKKIASIFEITKQLNYVLFIDEVAEQLGKNSFASALVYNIILP
jgi:hypothetical protein